MEATIKPILQPKRLAAEMARASETLRKALACGDLNTDGLSLLYDCLDLPLSAELRRQRDSQEPERFTVAAQLVAFGLLLAAHDGRLDAMAERLGAGHPAEELFDVISLADVQTVVQTDRRDAAAVDALAQFQELYLRACDAQLRRRRGVFYTPAPIVDWILRAVDHCLEHEFSGVKAVRCIDPACGSGAFLSAAMSHRWNSLGSEVPVSLTGFEVLPATKAAAESLLCRRLDQRFQREIHLECVNPLTAGETLASRILGEGDQLPVILGNPPYANYGRQNKGAWISRLLRDYKAGLKERKLNLDDDFIKFLRWGQYWIERAGRGVLAMITSRTYLDGLTHRAMRGSLAGAFDEMFVLDLGGDRDAQRGATQGMEDENVFNIRRGVAIGVFVRRGGNDGPARVRHHALRGTREEKFARLDGSDLGATSWEIVTLQSPQNLFVPQRRPCNEYRTWPRIIDVFPEYVSGVQTKNDAILTDIRRAALVERIRALLDGEAGASGNGDSQQPFVERAREKFGDRLSGLQYDESRLREYLVAPFDRRWIYYEPRLLGRARFSTMRHLLRPNVALVFMRQSTCEGPYDHFLATDTLASDRVFYSTHGAPFLAPLWLWEEGGDGSQFLRRANLALGFAQESAERIGASYRPDNGSRRAFDEFADDGTLTSSATVDAIGPEDIFHVLYAMFFRSDYRRRYHDELRCDFPRVPPVDDRERFLRLRKSGRRLVALHTQGTVKSMLDVQAPGALSLADIPRPLREWRLGGYHVLTRWLRKRGGGPLADDDRSQWFQLLHTAVETARLVREIDAI